MAKARSASKRRTLHKGYHRDGSLWFKGYMKGEVMDGPWEWYRKDGVIMRSGQFVAGAQAGKWVTYDRNGKVFKVTQMKADETAKSKKKSETRK
jgi:antitoxin component YwqK of YwqJK toxin-antitoxin module